MTETAKTYGGALYDLAKSENLTDTLLQNLQLVSRMFSENAGYGRMLANPAISRPDRRQLIDDAWQGTIHPYACNFMKLLCDNGTISQFGDCANEYRRRYNEDHGILCVRAVSAVPMADELAEKLRRKIGRMTGKTVELTVRVDDSVLGGVRLELPGRQLDGTVQHHLDALARKLRSADLQAGSQACDQ